MKIIDTTQGTDPNAQQPFIAPSLKFIQDASKEAIANVVRNLIGLNADTTKMYILYGCVNSGSGSNYIISAGAIYFEGEIYEVDAATFTLGGGEVAVATITVTNPSPDPILFKDGSSHSVHNVRKIVIDSAASGSGDADWSDIINVMNRGEIKMFGGTLATHFDTGTGLGKITGGWYGWALCDGSNGTVDLRGKFIVGYDGTDSDYNAIGDTGGAKTVTLTAAQSGLPAHSHSYTFNDGVGNTAASGGFALQNNGTTQSGTANISNNSGASASSAHENRPPFYTLAFIQRV